MSRSGRYAELAQLTFWFLLGSDILLLGWWHMMLPAVALLLLLVLLLAGGVWLWTLRRHGLALLRTPLDRPLLFLLLVLLLTTALALDPSRSWRFVWQWAGCIWLYYLAVTLFRAGWSRRAFAKGLLLTLTVVMAGAYFQLYGLLRQWYAAGPWPNLLPPTLPRIWGFTGSPNLLAIMLNLGVLLAAGYWQTSLGRKPLPLWGWLFLTAPLLILPASRSGWLGLLVGGAALVAIRLLGRPAGQRLTRRTLWQLAAGGGLALALFLTLIITLRGQTLQLSQLGTALYRLDFWRVALLAWRAAPLWGSGLNSYATYYMLNMPVPPETLYVAAHNIFFQALADMGLLGLLALGWLTFSAWRCLRRAVAAGPDGLTQGMIAGLAAFFVHALFDTPESWIMALAALLLGGIVAQAKNQTSETRWDRPVAVVWLLSWFVLLLAGILGYQVSGHYFAATAAAGEGEWTAALADLQQAQVQLPYEDSGILAFQALLEGGLAAREPERLPAAIAAYERLIKLEPGWGAHRANLAALYWQAGERDQALALMAEAVAQTPAVAPYQLNLLNWQAAMGESDPAGWQTLYALPDTWDDAPLWAAHGVVVDDAVPQAAPQTVAEAQALLAAGAIEPAAAQFDALRAADPYDAGAQLGWGISQLLLGDEPAAADAFRRVSALERLRGVGTIWSQEAQLWRALLSTATPKQLATLQLQLREQSPYGPGRGGQGNYTMTVLLRMPPPADLLPQLRCFTVRTPLVAPLQLADRELGAAWAEPLLLGAGDGTISCWSERP